MSMDDSVLVDPFEAGTLDEAAELSAFARALELAEDFSLIFVRCNQAPHRERLMEEVQTLLPKFKIQMIMFREPIHHLLDSIREQLATPLPDAVFVSGLEHSLPVIAESYAAPLIANLNASRNSFPQTLSCPLVLWVPQYVLTSVIHGAPDFFSIRSSVYSFAPAPAEMSGLVRSFAGDNYDEAANLPLAEKRDRIAALVGLLSDYKSLPNDQRDYQAELRLHFQLGDLLLLLGVYDEAMKHYQRSLQLSEKLKDRIGLSNSVSRIGMIHQDRGEYREAILCYEQVLQIENELGDYGRVATVLHQVATLNLQGGEYDKALTGYEQSRRIYEELGDRAGFAKSLQNIGILHQQRGEYPEALACYEQSGRTLKELGDRAGFATSLHQIGVLHHQRGEYSEALSRYEQSHQIYEELGNRAGAARSLGQLGKLFMESRRYEEAYTLMLNVLVTFIELQSPNAKLAVNDLKKLRAKWGAQPFDAAWQSRMGEEVPDWLTSEVQATAS